MSTIETMRGMGRPIAYQITGKQLTFLSSYADALVEHLYGRSLNFISVGNLTLALESVGIDHGTPEFGIAMQHIEERGVSFDLPPDLIGILAQNGPAKPTQKSGFVYVLENDSFPGLVKIGYTTRDNVDARVYQLSSATGMPTPFRAIHQIQTDNPIALEAAIHEALSEYRIQRKEFFRCDSGKAIAVCEACHQEMEQQK